MRKVEDLVSCSTTTTDDGLKSKTWSKSAHHYHYCVDCCDDNKPGYAVNRGQAHHDPASPNSNSVDRSLKQIAQARAQLFRFQPNSGSTCKQIPFLPRASKKLLEQKFNAA